MGVSKHMFVYRQFLQLDPCGNIPPWWVGKECEVQYFPSSPFGFHGYPAFITEIIKQTPAIYYFNEYQILPQYWGKLDFTFCTPFAGLYKAWKCSKTGKNVTRGGNVSPRAGTEDPLSASRPGGMLCRSHSPCSVSTVLTDFSGRFTVHGFLLQEVPRKINFLYAILSYLHLFG